MGAGGGGGRGKRECVSTHLSYGYSTDAGVKDARVGAGRHLAGKVEFRVPQHTVASDVLPDNDNEKQVKKR